MPEVSINLCCYNGEAYLEETLQSIFRQTYKDWELVVVNDGSTDSTEKIINKYKAEGWPIISYYQENAGLANARNTALRLSTGEYIAFIDQDDIWLPDKLEKQVPLLANKDVGLVFSDAIYFNNSGRESLLYGKRKVPTGNIFRELFANFGYLCIATVVVSKRSLVGLSEWFDERLQIGEESDVFCRIAYSCACEYVREPLVRYRIHENSASWTKMGRAPQETELIIEKYRHLIPDFERRFAHEINLLKGHIQYEYAKSDLLKGNNREARRRLLPILLRDLRFAALYFLTFSPKSVLDALMNMKRVMPSAEKRG